MLWGKAESQPIPATLIVGIYLFANILTQSSSCKGHDQNQSEGGEEESGDGP